MIPGATAISESAISALPDRLTIGAQIATLSLFSIVVPERSTTQGILISSTSWVWDEIVQALGDDWTLAYRLTPERWEEIVAGAFKKAQYDESRQGPDCH